MNKKTAPQDSSPNTNNSGGSYKEKQPMKKPSTNESKSIPVDEDSDGKADHAEGQKKSKSRNAGK